MVTFAIKKYYAADYNTKGFTMSDISSTFKENFVPLKPLSRSTQQNGDRHYRYNDEPVEVIVIFDEGDNKVAIVENSQGEQFDVPMSALRTL